MSCYKDNGEGNHLCAGDKDKLECYRCELYVDYDIVNNPHTAIRFSSLLNNEQINTEGKIVVGYQGIGKSTPQSVESRKSLICITIFNIMIEREYIKHE